MRTAILARVSTSDQHSIPMQIEEMRAYCQLRGWTIEHEFTEEISGAARKRPGRDSLMKLAKERKIDAVVVWRLNRFGRSAGELILLLSELQELGVAFVSIREHLDLSSPIGRMMGGILAVFAQFEREILVENVKAGIAAYRAKNETWGRPATARAKKTRAVEMKKAGKSPARIAKELKISRASVYRLLA